MITRDLATTTREHKAIAAQREGLRAGHTHGPRLSTTAHAGNGPVTLLISRWAPPG